MGLMDVTHSDRGEEMTQILAFVGVVPGIVGGKINLIPSLRCGKLGKCIK